MEDKTKYQLRNLVIPQFLYKESRLTLSAFKVYCFIHAYINPFFFGNEHLAEMFGVKEQVISDAITKLEELGYIHCEYKPKLGGGKTRLVIDDYSDKSLKTNRKNNSEATTSHGRLDKDIKDNNIKENFFTEDLKDSDEFDDFLRRKRERRAKKQPFGYSRPNGHAQSFQRPTKGVVDARDVR